MSKRKYPRKNDSVRRREYVEKCGTICKCCGSTENIEYHHIIPLWMGGSDDISNIMALCHDCHQKIHSQIPKCHKNQGGRHSIVSQCENAESIFEMYINGEIGNKKAIELLGYHGRTRMAQIRAFADYLDNKGISRVLNNIDIRGTVAKDGLQDGDIVGTVTWKDGTETPLVYKDTGANDVEYKNRELKNNVRLEKDIEKDNDEMRNQEYDQIFNMYTSGEIGNKELKRLIGLNQKTSIDDFAPLKGYMERNGIIEIFNDLDGRMCKSNGNLPDGSIVARISFANGEETFATYKKQRAESKAEVCA